MMRALVVTLCFAACAATPTTSAPVVAASVATTPLIPRSKLFASPDHARPLLSPDGTQLAWLAPLGGILNIWVAAPGDVTAGRALTHDTARDIKDYRWTYDNKHVLYTRDAGGDENTHVFILDVTTGVSSDATPFQGAQAYIVAMSPSHRNSVLVASNHRDPQLHDIFELDLDTATTHPLYENHAKFTEFAATDDFKTLIGRRLNDDGTTELALIDTTLKECVAPHTIATIAFEDQLTTYALGFSSDGHTLYMADSRERDTAALVALDIASGKTRQLAEDARCDLSEVTQHPATHAPQVAHFEYDTVNYTLLDKSITADFAALRATDTGTITWDATLDDRHWTVTFTRDDGQRYYLYDRDTQRARYLFSSRTELEKEKLAHRRAVVIPARDGVQLVSYLTLPASASDIDRPQQPLPMVLYVHGGPWWRDSSGFDSVAQLLANRGYAVLQVNFRGSTGFGKRFVNLGDLAWGGAMQDDLVDAVQWGYARSITKPGMVAIFGGSYGGYATLVGLTRDPLMFACGIDVVGPSNLETFMATIPSYWKPWITQWYKRVGDPRSPEGQALLRERSPLTHAQAIKRPLLISHGANDPRVKRAESQQLVAALRARQIPVTYVLFPDEGHSFGGRPANRLALVTVIEQFLAQHLGGRFEIPGNDSDGTSMVLDTGEGARSFVSQ